MNSTSPAPGCQATVAHKQPRLPSWLRRPIHRAGKKSEVEKELRCRSLHTVCEEAKCPNRGECFGKGTATFLIMGDVCSRNCRFCSVSNGQLPALDPHEPTQVAETSAKLGLSYVVVTSVTRDDLPDGGSAHFAATVTALRSQLPSAKIEVLVPDFRGNSAAIDTVIDSGPHVFNHNVETVPRLYSTVRPQADYHQSLEVLAYASRKSIITKSGIMVGLGETEDEVLAVMQDLRDAGVQIVTIGQYLRPSRDQLPVAEYVTPEQFEKYGTLGREMGFRQVVSAPFVRSSYNAADVFSDSHD